MLQAQAPLRYVAAAHAGRLHSNCHSTCFQARLPRACSDTQTVALAGQQAREARSSAGKRAPEAGCALQVIVFSDNIFCLREYATRLRKPFIYGATSHAERTQVLHAFKHKPEVGLPGGVDGHARLCFRAPGLPYGCRGRPWPASSADTLWHGGQSGAYCTLGDHVLARTPTLVRRPGLVSTHSAVFGLREPVHGGASPCPTHAAGRAPLHSTHASYSCRPQYRRGYGFRV